MIAGVFQQTLSRDTVGEPPYPVYRLMTRKTTQTSRVQLTLPSLQEGRLSPQKTPPLNVPTTPPTPSLFSPPETKNDDSAPEGRVRGSQGCPDGVWERGLRESIRLPPSETEVQPSPLFPCDPSTTGNPRLNIDSELLKTQISRPA